MAKGGKELCPVLSGGRRKSSKMLDTMHLEPGTRAMLGVAAAEKHTRSDPGVNAAVEA